MTTGRVMVVDDEEVIRITVTELLTQKGLEVSCAENGERALEGLQAGAFDLFIVDKNLPGFDGVEVIRRIRAIDRHCGILMATGYSTVESADRVLHLGVDGYLRKPFPDIRQMQRTALEVIAAAQQRRRNTIAEASGPSTVVVASPLPEVRRALDEVLAEKGCRILSATTPEELDALVSAQPPDVICFDEGFETPRASDVIARIEEDLLGVVFVVINVNPSLDDLIAYISLGVRVVLRSVADEPDFNLKIDQALHAAA